MFDSVPSGREAVRAVLTESPNEALYLQKKMNQRRRENEYCFAKMNQK